jgi:GDPmannose 4,6-dehydratase
MLQQESGEDYVIASGVSRTVRDMVRIAFEYVDLDYEDYVVVDPEFVRPPDPVPLLGDPSRAREKLGWEPRTTLEELVQMMVQDDLHRGAALSGRPLRP